MKIVFIVIVLSASFFASEFVEGFGSLSIVLGFLAGCLSMDAVDCKPPPSMINS